MNVYCLKFPKTDYYYIGSTTRDPVKRFIQHKSTCNSKKPANLKLARIWKKHGDPELIVMGTYDNEKDMLDAEQFYINVSIKDPDCLNLNPFADRAPGTKGRKLSTETRAKISAALTGIKRSSEAIANMIVLRSNPIIAVDPKGNETHYSSINECSKQTGLGYGNIQRSILSGKSATKGRCKGWYFRRVE